MEPGIHRIEIVTWRPLGSAFQEFAGNYLMSLATKECDLFYLYYCLQLFSGVDCRSLRTRP
jgi:hypothetical protein